MIETIAIGLTFIALTIASIVDLKTAEIPEPTSTGLTGVLLLISLAVAITTRNYLAIVIPIIVGLSYFIVSAILFYLGQWGGGDVKITAAVGVLLGFLSSQGYIFENTKIMPYWVSYWTNMAILSIPYVIAYTILIGLFQTKVFTNFIKEFIKPKITALFLFSFTPVVISHILNLETLTKIYIIIPFLTILTFYLKSVEKTAMMKEIPVEKLALWDIVAEDIVVEGEKIASKRDIEGIDEKQLAKINQLAKDEIIPRKIMIKWGVKFGPILLFALIATLYLGNILEILMLKIFGANLVL